RRSIKLTDVAILLRDGFLTRSFSVLTYDRLQSTLISQGPWDRKKDLAGIHFHLVESGLYIEHLDSALASSLYTEITRRATISRQKESQEAWAARAVPGAR
ncbi:PH domain-containing protein, partial [Enterococcus faecalis]|nr:PH domain-containing protein [Enterococcus faecalis]